MRLPVLDPGRIRADAIFFVNGLRERFIAVPGSELVRFSSQDQQIFLRGPQGIFKPKELDEPLTILSSLASSYDDEPLDGDRIRYGFLSEAREFDNDGLKRVAEFGLPVIYLMQVCSEPTPEYEVFAPVWVLGWDDAKRQFLIDLSGDRPDHVARGLLPVVEGGQQLPLLDPFDHTLETVASIGFVKGNAMRRVHRAHFRRTVLDAYGASCAVCSLRIRSLLDAAWIRPGLRFDSVPPVNEGLCLCVLHQRAFDAGILGYDTSYTIMLNLPPRKRRSRAESAMFYSLQGKKLRLPKDEANWPIVPATADTVAVEPVTAAIADDEREDNA